MPSTNRPLTWRAFRDGISPSERIAACQRAYEALDEKERLLINLLVEEMVDQIKCRPHGVQIRFSRQMALEAVFEVLLSETLARRTKDRPDLYYVGHPDKKIEDEEIPIGD